MQIATRGTYAASEIFLSSAGRRGGGCVTVDRRQCEAIWLDRAHSRLYIVLGIWRDLSNFSVLRSVLTGKCLQTPLKQRW